MPALHAATSTRAATAALALAVASCNQTPDLPAATSTGPATATASASAAMSTSVPTTSAPTSVPTSAPTSAASAPTAVPGAPEPAVVLGVKAACKADVGGPDATVRVWRLGERVVALELQPGPSHGPHAPWVYFDKDGKELVRVANRPVGAASKEAAEAKARRESATQGGIPVESLACTTWLAQP
jgi:hypothetical protein